MPLRGKHSNGTLSIEREGTFTIGKAKTRKQQCGEWGTDVLRYRVKVTGTTRWAKQGWLLDNQDIPSYFEQKYAEVTQFLSCEHIAERALEDFCTLVEGGGSRVKYIMVSISGIPGSWITAEWSAA